MCVCGVWGVGGGQGIGFGLWGLACSLVVSPGWVVWGRVGAWELVHVPLALALVGLWCVVWCGVCMGGGLGLVWLWFVCGGGWGLDVADVWVGGIYGRWACGSLWCL